MFSRFYQYPKIIKCINKLTKTGSPHKRSRYINLCKVLNNILITDDVTVVNDDFTFVLDLWFNDRAVILNIHKHLKSIGICMLDEIVISKNFYESGQTFYYKFKHVGEMNMPNFKDDNLTAEDFYDFFDFNEYYKDQIEACPNDIMAISIELSVNENSDSHENMLIIKRIHNSPIKFSVEIFEPLGYALSPKYNFTTELEQLIYQLLSYGVDSPDEIQIINVAQNCSIQSKLSKTLYANSCAILSLWYAIRRLLNPEEDPYQTYREIEDFVKRYPRVAVMKRVVASFVSLLDIDDSGIINKVSRINPEVLDKMEKANKMGKAVKYVIQNKGQKTGGRKRKSKHKTKRRF